MFPNFNIYSTPLLVLGLQGLIFAGLLLYRYFNKRNISDLLLALILLITCWHQTTYTIGFMAWYDTYQNTKINYWLINQSLALAPLIYFYVRSVTEAHFRFVRKDIWHFILAIIYTLFKFSILAYDSAQPGFEEVQNGILRSTIEEPYINPFLDIIRYMQMLLYLAFTFQLYYRYRGKIQQLFSNIYDLELNWLRNFLFVYTFLFLYSMLQVVINTSIVDLHWTQEWWYYFFSSLIIIYIGIKGYFTKTNKLNEIDLGGTGNIELPSYAPLTATASISISQGVPELSEELNRQKEHLLAYMSTETPHLNPDLNLIELAKSLKMTRAQLSEVINLGCGKNFNDFINEYRVNAVVEQMKAGRQAELSLLGIAYECGFNSKATFNRVFKKWKGESPSQFMAKME